MGRCWNLFSEFTSKLTIRLWLVWFIKPADIGFNTVEITPHPGNLTQVKASMPHPKGRISVKYEIKNGKLNAFIELPEGVHGKFIYKNQMIDLIGSKTISL